MKIKQFQVDAFTQRVFGGNQAAVCLLNEWIEPEIMQNIATENNLSETAFVVDRPSFYEIRWFTPRVEIDLAGHPTLAAAHVIFNHLKFPQNEIVFRSGVGDLPVKQLEDGKYQLNFPSRKPKATKVSKNEVADALGVEPIEVLESRDLLCVLENEQSILHCQPNHLKLLNLTDKGIIITASGEHADFVSRFFAPAFGIPEDPVTGSAHCSLVAYWAEKLNKNRLEAVQLSERRGFLSCELWNEQILLAGHAVTFSEGFIFI